MGKNGAHLRFDMLEKGTKIRTVAFKRGSIAGILAGMPQQIKIVGTLSLNVWRNHRNLQVIVADITTCGSWVVDHRTQHLTRKMFAQTGTYVFFHVGLMKRLTKFVDDSSRMVLANHLSRSREFDNIVLVDCPDSIQQFRQFIHQIDFKRLVLYLWTAPQDSYRMPRRDQYARLFRFIASHHDVDIAHYSRLLGAYLKIPMNSLVSMLRIFRELHFISVDHGLMNQVPHPRPRSLRDAKTYQQLIDQTRTEQRLLLTSSEQLIHYINQLNAD